MTGAAAKKSTVYFSDLRANARMSLLDKAGALFDLCAGDIFKKGHLVAVKLHFGEKGNTSYIPPVFVRRVVEKIKKTGAHPFLTDTNTLYVGTRGNSVEHLKTAIENGFDYSVVSAPLIIADGLRGEAGVPVRVDGRYFESVNIASGIVNANGLAVLTHFKCHEMTGFGGALKNIGMGCANREGKLAQHSNVAPVVDPSGCTACGECALVCPAGAIDIKEAAFIDNGPCVGCGRCIPACPEATIKVQWDETTAKLQEKMIEHAAGVLKAKEGRCVFMNFVTQVSPACDCYGHNDSPIVPDIGILASTDPVALDQASADLVINQEGFRDTALKTGHAPGGDKFRGVHPDVDWAVQLECARRAGLGTRDYRLEKTG